MELANVKKEKKSKKKEAKQVEETAVQDLKKPKKVRFDQLSKGRLEGDDEVYQTEVAKLRDRKAARKEQSAKLKEQALQETQHQTQAIQRNVQRDIILNKGLTRKRPKKDRNPRVKKRMQYEAMLKKRKTVVKEYAGGHSKAYAGEESGIKTGLVRGIKM